MSYSWTQNQTTARVVRRVRLTLRTTLAVRVRVSARVRFRLMYISKPASNLAFTSVLNWFWLHK